MDADFWQARWAEGRIGFHADTINPPLLKHFDDLSLTANQRVFVPLCGKTLDIAWLLDKGHAVVGVELVVSAVEQLFASLGCTPQVAEEGSLIRFSYGDLVVYAGDVFDLSTDTLGAVDAVYDRAALVALPEAMRVRYSNHVTALSHAAPQLLVTVEYDQHQADGPPFSIGPEAVSQLYSRNYKISSLRTTQPENGLRGKLPLQEHTWLLQPSDVTRQGA